LQNCWDIAAFFGHIHVLPFLRTNFNVYFSQFPSPLFQCCMTFQCILKSTKLNATMFRGRRVFGENMKRGFRALKIWMSQIIEHECRFNFICHSITMLWVRQSLRLCAKGIETSSVIQAQDMMHCGHCVYTQ